MSRSTLNIEVIALSYLMTGLHISRDKERYIETTPTCLYGERAEADS